MATPLRILIVEDSEADAELLLRELRRGGYAPEFERVETPEGLDAALARQSWDLVVSDYAMPRFNGLQALKLTQEKGLDIPFIIVSGSIGEDVAVAAMKAGAHDYLMKDNTARLLPAIARELREARMRRERRQSEETIHRLAYIDPITGLPNRVRFREQVRQAIEEAKKQRHPLALLHLNLEHFREVNDTLGHNRGDSLLQQVGMRLRSALFTPDVVARLGADEFGILLPRLAAIDNVRHIIKKIQDCLEAPFTIDGIPIAVEASLGVATMPEHADDADTLLQRADIAMHQAKQMASGYAVYAPEYDRHSPRATRAHGGVARRHRARPAPAPFPAEGGTLKPAASSASKRWCAGSTRAFVLLPPDKFILAAEQTGLIGPLTRWVLIHALNHCVQARCEGIQLRVSVNLRHARCTTRICWKQSRMHSKQPVPNRAS